MIHSQPDFTLHVSDTISLEILHDVHAEELFLLINKNRTYLRKWLPWVDRMRSLAQFREFIKHSKHRAALGQEVGCVIKERQLVAGRSGIYNIDIEKRNATLGYWIAENQQGKGIITGACRTLINHAFTVLQLDAVEIRCATNNRKSMAIAERLNFCRSGIIKNGEFFNHRFVDLYVYNLTKAEWSKLQSEATS